MPIRALLSPALSASIRSISSAVTGGHEVLFTGTRLTRAPPASGDKPSMHVRNLLDDPFWAAEICESRPYSVNSPRCGLTLLVHSVELIPTFTDSRRLVRSSSRTVLINFMPEVLLRMPTVSDGIGISRLVRRCQPLDVNSHYLYLLLCHHFAETCAVAECDGTIAGFLSAYRPPRQQDTLFVWQVAVDKAQRGRRLASRMVEHVMDRTICKDVRFVEATISPSNGASQSFFRALARRMNAECHVQPLFTQDMFPADLFPGAEPHEAEEGYRIGPISRLRSTEKEN